MLNSNDFLKTRAGFAYVRECVKFGFDVADAVLFTRDLYEIEVHYYEIHGRMMVTDLTCFVCSLRSFDGRYRIHKYNRSTCKYDCVYDGAAKVLCSWVTDGDLRFTGYDEYEEFEVPLDVYNTDTCAGDARKLVYNQYTYKLNHKPLYSVVEDVAANPYSWLVVNVHACATEVFRASAVFMRDECGAALPF